MLAKPPAAHGPSRLPGLLLGRSAAQRQLVTPTLVSFALHVAYCGSHLLAHALGLVSLQATAWLMSLYLGQSLVFYGLVRSGLSRRLGRDPALTQAQMAVAMVSLACTYLTLDGGRGALVSMPLLMLMFGAFGLPPRQTLQMAAGALLSLGLTIAWCAWQAPNHWARGVEVYHLGLALINLSAATALALRLSQLVQRLRSQREELKTALARIQAMATRDALTGLSNRHHLHEVLDIERQRCAREGLVFCVGLFDLDLFKTINDRHGHATGDRVLRDFAAVAGAEARALDTLGRWGGEEFLLVLAHTRKDDAQQVMERIRRAVQAGALGGLPAGAVTVSGGLAQYRPGEALEVMLERADQGLYAAKAQGRNQVLVLAQPDAPDDAATEATAEAASRSPVALTAD